jgi:adenine-specific DNA-methyltransferase
LKSLLPEFEGRVKCIYIDPPYNTGNEGWVYNDNVNDPKINWQKIFSPKNSARHLSESHDYVVLYAKNAEAWRPKLIPRQDEQDARYKNPDDDPRGHWTSGDLSARNYYSEGTYSISCPSGRLIAGPPKGTYWRVSKDTFDKLVADERIWWGKDGNNVPRLKRFLSEVKDGVVPETLWLHTQVGNTQEAKKEVISICDFEDSASVFITPKPSRLIKRILEIGTERDSIILDSFAGSGTTAHAVLQLNQEDGGDRKFILIETMDYAETITAERVRRVMTGYGEDTKAVAGLGGGFDFYEMGEPLFLPDGNLNEAVSVDEIRRYVAYSEGVAPESLLERDNEHSPYLLGWAGETAVIFYYEPQSETRLDARFLSRLRFGLAPAIIYADVCLLDEKLMKRRGIIFKKIPRDVRKV